MTALVPTLIAQFAFHPAHHALEYGAGEEPLEADVPDEQTA